MVARPSLVVASLAALASLGAQYRTTNFVVQAPTPQVAQQVGQWAEYYRKEKARLWLGQEMPNWAQPCPLRVTVTMSGAGGATSFAFDRGRILQMDMHIEGPLDRLIKSVLPHEVTHTVFAHYFRCPVPRWADEGGSVLGEDDVERNRHEVLVRQILRTPGRQIPLRRLFALTEYPRDVMVLYAEGYSVTNFLVGQSSRGAFLAFIAHGMRGNWDAAVRAHYRYNSIEELEQAWYQHLRNNSRPPAVLASGGPRPTSPVASAAPQGRLMVRSTVPPAPPLPSGDPAVYRGVAAAEPAPRRPSLRDLPELPAPYAPSAAPRPGPGFAMPVSAPPSSFVPDRPAVPPPPPARLLPPQFDVAPPPGYGRAAPVGPGYSP